MIIDKNTAALVANGLEIAAANIELAADTLSDPEMQTDRLMLRASATRYRELARDLATGKLTLSQTEVL